MRATVYIETSIFSFYHDDRTSAAVVAMREWTHAWWDGHAERYNLVTSVAVLAELEQGNLPHQRQALEMAAKLPAIPIEVGVE